MAKAPNSSILNPPSTSTGAVKNASKGRISSIKGGGANFSAAHDMKSGFPPPRKPC